MNHANTNHKKDNGDILRSDKVDFWTLLPTIKGILPAIKIIA